LTVKRILLYLKGTVEYRLFYKKREKSDLTRDQDDRRRTYGFVFKINSSVISWSSKKQSIVTLLTTLIYGCDFICMSNDMVEENS